MKHTPARQGFPKVTREQAARPRPAGEKSEERKRREERKRARQLLGGKEERKRAVGRDRESCSCRIYLWYAVLQVSAETKKRLPTWWSGRQAVADLAQSNE
jgi:hypothetical protein